MPETLDARDLIATFEESFTAPLRLRQGRVIPQPLRPLTQYDTGFTWIAGYVHALPMVGAPRSSGYTSPAWSSLGSRSGDILRGEREVYPNADAIAATGVIPLRQEGRHLALVADHMPDRIRPLVPDRLPSDYLSGALVSYPYGQLYGVFEMRARLPRGRGLWPAFWLLPCDLSWPPEIDVMEVLGHDPSTLYSTVHTRQLGHNQHFGKAHSGTDLAGGFNSFAVDWGPDNIDFFLNRQRIFTYPTPADLHKPCYLLLNLAVGADGSWPGSPNATTRFPAEMIVDHVRVWQRQRYVSAR